ncbi:MAG: hypothetical protein ACKPKO_60020 [Candidatus Fonsibacter sp.]
MVYNIYKCQKQPNAHINKCDQSYLLKMDIDVLHRIAKAREIDIIDKSKSTDKKVKYFSRQYITKAIIMHDIEPP